MARGGRYPKRPTAPTMPLPTTAPAAPVAVPCVQPPNTTLAPQVEQPSSTASTIAPLQPQPQLPTAVPGAQVGRTIHRTPHFLRPTHHALPSTAADLAAYGLPVGLIAEPLAPRDAEVPVVDFTGSFSVLPPRCIHCKAFINCYCTVLPNERAFVCSICGTTTACDAQYISGLYAGTSATLGESRPELTHEAYDILAPTNYNSRTPNQALFQSYFFVIDVSPQAITSGFTAIVCEACTAFIQRCIDESTDDTRIMIGLVLFNTCLHYVLVRDDVRFEIHSVPLIDERFIPAPRDIVVRVSIRGHALINALRQVVAIFSKPNTIPPPCSKLCETGTTRDVCFGAALDAAYVCLSTIGGKLMYFLSSLPSCGQGALHPEIDKRCGALLFDSGQKGFDTGDIIKRLLTPDGKHGLFYEELAVRASINFVSIDGYLAPPGFVSANGTTSIGNFLDPATLAELSRCTSGRYNYYPDFAGARDRDQLYSDILDVLDCTLGMDACSRIRTTPGIEISYTYGSIYQRQDGLTAMAQYTDQCAFGCELSYTTKVLKENAVRVQLSFLYTTRDCKRMVRVVTKSLQVVQGGLLGTTPGTVAGLGTFVAGIDVQAQVTLLAKKLACVMRTNSGVTSPSCTVPMLARNNDSSYITATGSISSAKSYNDVVAGVFGAMVNALHFIRVALGRQLDPQLSFLPSGLQVLPLLVYALLNTHMMRPTNVKSARLEARVLSMMRLERGTIEAVVTTVYPTIYELVPPNGPGTAWTHEAARLGTEYLKPTGVYLLEDVHAVYVFFHREVDDGVIAQFCRPNTPEGEFDHKKPLQLLDSAVMDPPPWSLQLLEELTDDIRERRHSYLPIFPISAKSAVASAVVACLIESRQNGYGFQDFLRMTGHALGTKAAR